MTQTIRGDLVIELFDKDNNLISREETTNLITSAGDHWYAMRAVTDVAPEIAGMKLGTSSTTPAKTGGGAALGAYLSNSHQALDGQPDGSNGSITFVATFGPGKATSASPITEAVLVVDPLADATSTTGNTVARALISTVPSKASDATLVVSWTHTLIGQAV